MDMLTALNGKDLMRQAAATAQHYMICAVKDNNSLAVAMPRNTPDLVAAYMQTATLDFGASTIARELRREEGAPSATATWGRRWWR
jgi:hypothetical protein